MIHNIDFILESGDSIPVVIENKRNIRNVTIRPKSIPKYEIHVSKPWLVSISFVKNFLETKRKWIENYFHQLPKKNILKDGDIITIFGRSVRLKHDGSIFCNKYIDTEKTVLCIGGREDMFENRLRNFIKQEFLYETKCMMKIVSKEYWPKRISLRDTSSRWGSCSSTGTISLSWRLAFAPTEVMRYVIIHEMAHRKHMNHSANFWKTVSELYGFGVERAKRWLSKNGQQLYKWL